MKFVTHQTTLHLSFKIKCCVDRLRPPPFADISKSKQTETAETRSTAAQLRKSFCHRKGIEPTFREGSPRSCAKMWQSEIESRLGRIGVQHETSRQLADSCGIQPTLRRPLALDDSDQ